MTDTPSIDQVLLQHPCRIVRRAFEQARAHRSQVSCQNCGNFIRRVPLDIGQLEDLPLPFRERIEVLEDDPASALAIDRIRIGRHHRARSLDSRISMESMDGPA